MATQQQYSAFEANNKALNDSLVWNYHQSQVRDAQETAAASAQKEDTAIEAMKARSTANVAAAAGGVGGNSVQGLFDEFWTTQGRSFSRINEQLDFSRQASFMERKSGQMQTNAQIQRMHSDLPNPTLAFVGAAARLAGDVGGAYYKYTTPVTIDGVRTRRFG